MPSRRQLRLNKHYSWQDIVRTYPDTFVFLTNTVFDRGRLISGTLVAVSDFKHREETANRLYHTIGNNFTVMRTTPNNHLWEVLYAEV